jgi:BASS family bile acid:Na+ symporter
MLLLMLLTVVYVPVALPMLIPGTSVDSWTIAKPLLLMMVGPLVLGTLMVRFFPLFSMAVQPWIGRFANVALYAAIAATLIGYFRSMFEIGGGPVLVVLVTIAAAFGFGYLAGGGRDHLEDVGGLGTAQRNTAAGFIIATQNFDDPDILVMLTVANTLAIVILLFLARALRHDNPP